MGYKLTSKERRAARSRGLSKIRNAEDRKTLESRRAPRDAAPSVEASSMPDAIITAERKFKEVPIERLSPERKAELDAIWTYWENYNEK